jgi:hypothetical protein
MEEEYYLFHDREVNEGIYPNLGPTNSNPRSDLSPTPVHFPNPTAKEYKIKRKERIQTTLYIVPLLPL